MPAFALLFAVLAAEPAPLEALLKKAAESEKVRSEKNCSFIETTVTEELDADGKVTSTLTRVYEVEQRGLQMKKTLKSEKEAGESMTGQLKKDRFTESRFTCLHPQMQPHFKFEAKGVDEKGRAKVAFAAIEADPKRGIGEALVELETGALLQLKTRPSKNPAFVDKLDLVLGFGPTACGHYQTSLQSAGEAGLLMYRARFRGKTELTGHQPLGR